MVLNTPTAMMNIGCLRTAGDSWLIAGFLEHALKVFLGCFKLSCGPQTLPDTDDAVFGILRRIGAVLPMRRTALGSYVAATEG